MLADKMCRTRICVTKIPWSGTNNSWVVAWKGKFLFIHLYVLKRPKRLLGTYVLIILDNLKYFCITTSHKANGMRRSTFRMINEWHRYTHLSQHRSIRLYFWETIFSDSLIWWEQLLLLSLWTMRIV